MEPTYRVSHYLEFQRQLSASDRSSQKPLGDLPADPQLNSLLRREAGLRPIEEAEMKPPEGDSLTPLEICDLLAASKEMDFERPDSDSLRVERIKARLTEITLAFLLIAGLVTFGLACLLSPTLLG